jgi:predicted DNA-binding protein with PD1-like motif
MKSKLIHEQGEKTFALAFEPGDEVVAELTNLREREPLGCRKLYGYRRV